MTRKLMSNEIKEAVVRLWNHGLTGAQIAKEVGLPSRSAALGLLHRLRKNGLEIAPRVIGPTCHFKIKTREKTVNMNIAYPRNISLFELRTKSCRWPSGDPRVDLTFCGAKTLEKCSYCAEHAKLAYTSHGVSQQTAVRKQLLAS